MFWSADGPVGRGRKARGGGVECVAWRVHPRPTGEGHQHLPGAVMAFLPEDSLNTVLDVLSRSAEPPAEPVLARPLPASIPSSATGLVRTGVCVTPPVLVRTSSLRFRQNAVVSSISELPACGYGPRKPELTASRQPELRGPRPSDWGGRSGQSDMSGEGGEKMREILLGKTFLQGALAGVPGTGTDFCAAGRVAVQAGVLVPVCAEACICFLAPSCSRRIATLRRLALKPTSNKSPITGTRPMT